MYHHWICLRTCSSGGNSGKILSEANVCQPLFAEYYESTYEKSIRNQTASFVITTKNIGYYHQNILLIFQEITILQVRVILTFVPFLPTELEQFEFLRRFSVLTLDTCVIETRNYFKTTLISFGVAYQIVERQFSTEFPVHSGLRHWDKASPILKGVMILYDKLY